MTTFSKRPLAASVASAMLLSAASAPLFAQQEIDEIVVVGSQIRGAQISDALPVSIMNELDIEALGVNSGDELLEFMAEQGQNFFSESENISGGVNSARGDIGAFNLRNLGTGNTLVLLNGRRVVNSAAYQTESVGGSFVPVNTVNVQSIPVTGLRRTEVLREGASAIYGADAVAGVVNYVMKNDFDGLNVSLRADSYESIGRDDERLTVEWGTNFNQERTNVGASFNFFQRDRVNSQMTRAGPTAISVTAWATMNSTRPCFATIALIRVMGSTMFAQVYRAMACVTLLPTALANSKPTPSATAAVNTPSTMRSVALSMGRAPIAIT